MLVIAIRGANIPRSACNPAGCKLGSLSLAITFARAALEAERGQYIKAGSGRPTSFRGE